MLATSSDRLCKGQAALTLRRLCRRRCCVPPPGRAALERDDVAPILEQLKMNLLRKNVASEIADRRARALGASFP